jgi:hypothetical protein
VDRSVLRNPSKNHEVCKHRMMICLSISLFYTIQFPQYCSPHSRRPFLLNNTCHVYNFEYRSYIELELLQEEDCLSQQSGPKDM